MGADTVAKVVEECKLEAEGEKCGLDMSSYEDLHTVPSVGGAGRPDYNGNGKDDYVFVNGSDAAWDDHAEPCDENDSESNVENLGGGDREVNNSNESDALGNQNGNSDELKSEVKVDEEEEEIVNVESESEGKVEAGKINDGSNRVEDDVDVKVEGSEVMEGNDTVSVSDELKEGGNSNSSLDVRSNVVLDDDDDKEGIPSAADRVPDAGSPDKEEVQIESANVEAITLTSSGDAEEQLHHVEPQRNGDQGTEPEPAICEAEKVQVVEDNLQPNPDDRALGPLDSSLKEPEPCKTTIEHQSFAERVLKVQPSDGEFKGPQLPECSEPHPVDGDAKMSLQDEANTGNQPLDCQEPVSQPSDGESKELDTIETESKVKEQGSLGLPDVAKKEELSSLDSEAVTCQLSQSEEDESQKAVNLTADSDEVPEPDTVPVLCEDDVIRGQNATNLTAESEGVQDPLTVPVQCEVDEIKDEDASTMTLDSEEVPEPHSVHIQSEEGEIKGQNATNLSAELQEVQEAHTVPVQSEESESQTGVLSSDPTGHTDISNTDIPSEAEKTKATSATDIQSETSDNSLVDCETKRLEQEEESDLIAEVVGRQESSPGEDVHVDQVSEEPGSVNLINKETSVEDPSLENTNALEEASNISKTAAVNGEVVNENGDDLGGLVASENVSNDVVDHSQTASALRDCLRSGDGDQSIPVGNAADLSVSSNLGKTAGGGFVGHDSAVADDSPGLSAGDNSLQLQVENHAHDVGSRIRASNGEVDVFNQSNGVSNDHLKPKISFGSFECEAPFLPNDVNAKPELLNRSTELTSLNPKIQPSHVAAVLNSNTNGVHHTGFSHDDKRSPEDLSTEHDNKDNASASPLQEYVADASNGQGSNEVVRRPFYYLIRIPRYDDEKLREEIRLSEIEVQEQTQSRDSVRVEYQKLKATVIELKSRLQAARAEERAARELVIAKKQEMHSAQGLINRAKNAITVEDMHSQILKMEHRLQHETMSLNEEKQLLREIKQMTNLRDQLSANTCSQENLQKALDQRSQAEEHLKVLKKEMDALRDNQSKAERSVKVARKKYDDESCLLNELHERFASADKVQQKAYEDLLTLRKQWSIKNKYFWNYKDDAKAAYDFVVAHDNDSLERHCVNQVEKIMELWNENDEFRKEYIRCNMRSTLRRLRTLDGRSLGPDEEPPSLGIVSDDRVTFQAKVNSMATVLTREINTPVIAKTAGDNSSKKVVEQKNKSVIAKKAAEATSKKSLTERSKNSLAERSKNSLADASKNSLAEASGRIETEEEKEEERKLTKEEEERARKEEQLRREEEAARLREQRKLEEKEKAQEALERKRRMAEKAKAKAEFKARKEAEEKEMEREKRAMKKGKKKGLTFDAAESQPAVQPEPSSDTIREPEVTEKPMAVAKKSQKPSPYLKQIKTTKSIPPPLRNRGKRRMQPWMWALVAVVCVLALFFLGNSNVFRNDRLLSFGPDY